MLLLICGLELGLPITCSSVYMSPYFLICMECYSVGHPWNRMLDYAYDAFCASLCLELKFMCSLMGMIQVLFDIIQNYHFRC
jgi:hypothetical protein